MDTACHHSLIDAADKVPDWVHLLPAGTFAGRDGRGPWTLGPAETARVLEGFAAWGADLPVDYEHQSRGAEAKTGPVPGAGWIKELESRPDGLWGRVAWTETAARLLAAKEYRYISPVFRYEPVSGRIELMVGAGLTNNPNLQLEAVASRRQEEVDMDKDGKELRDILGLAATAGAEEVRAGVETLRKKHELLLAAQSAQAARESEGQAEPDPAKYVPFAQHEAVAKRLAEVEASMREREASEAVGAAMSAGKLAPAMREWAMGYARRDSEGFRAFVAAAPTVVGAQAMESGARPGSPVTEAEQTAARLLDMDVAVFTANNKE